MNLICAKQSEDWELLALGSLEEEAADLLRAHLRSGCALCNKHYAECVTAGLAMGVAAVATEEPGDHVFARLSQYTKSSPKLIAMPLAQKRSSSYPRAGWWAAAACASFAVWMSWQNYSLRQEFAVPKAPSVSPSPSSTASSIATDQSLRQQVAELETQLRQARSEASQPASPPAQIPPSTTADPQVQEVVANLTGQLRKASEEKEKLQGLAVEKERQIADLNQKLLASQADLNQQTQRLAAAQSPIKSDQETTVLQARLSDSQRAVERQRALLEEYRDAFRTLEAGSVKQVELAVVDSAAGSGKVRALYSPRGGLLVFAQKLPPLPSSKCYQLWILRNGNPSIVSGGLIRLDATGSGFLAAKPSAALEGVTGFALTDEPAGGSVIARGKKLLFGAI
jgi:hypothetical protein